MPKYDALYFQCQRQATMTDDTQTAQLRRTIVNSIENYDLLLLKRIAYEVRCEEMGIYPDMKYCYTNP